MLISSSTGRPYAVIANEGDFMLAVHPILAPLKAEFAVISHWRYVSKNEELKGNIPQNPEIFTPWDTGSGYSARAQSLTVTGIKLSSIHAKTGAIVAGLVAKVYEDYMQGDGLILEGVPVRDDFEEDYGKLFLSVAATPFYPPFDTSEHVGKTMAPDKAGAFAKSLKTLGDHQAMTIKPVEDGSNLVQLVPKSPDPEAAQAPKETQKSQEVDKDASDDEGSSLDKVVPFAKTTDEPA